MKQFIFYILFAIVFVSCNTQKSAISTDNNNSQLAWEPTEKALLWKITKKGHKDSYVYGTIHLIAAEDYFLPEFTETSLKSTDKIVYEINMEDMNDMGMAMDIMTKAFMKDGTTLSDLMSEEDYKMVTEHFEEMGLPMAFLNKIKPLFLSVLAGGDMDPNALNDGSILSYEMELDELATSAGLSKAGLETIDYQLEIFDKIPYEAQADMLLESINASSETGLDVLDIYAKIYKEQDLKKMHDMTLEEESGMQAYADILLYDRNRNWIPQIDELTKTESVFFAVGAGHLGGTKGVLALLKNVGFEVVPMK